MALLSVIASFWIAQNPELENKAGAVRIYHSGKAEAHIKTIPMPSAETAARAADVNLGLIKGLYAPKKNPYEGEVTSLIKCDKKFAAEEFTTRCPKNTAKAIAGGVGERHGFGVCTGADIRAVGVFFSCYDPEKKELTEVRLFLPHAKTPWKRSVSEAKALAGKLFP